MGRTILVGDVHGCADELDDLLARVGYVQGDDTLGLALALTIGHPFPQRNAKITKLLLQASVVGLVDHAAYCASKGALDQLTRVMSLRSCGSSRPTCRRTIAPSLRSLPAVRLGAAGTARLSNPPQL